MDWLKKTAPFFLIMPLVSLPGFSDCIDHYGQKAYPSKGTFMPELSVFFNEIDEDNNGYLSYEELVKSSNPIKSNHLELIIIWSLRESFSSISKLSNDEYFFESSGLSINDVTTYISRILNSKDYLALHRKLNQLSSGLMPEGIDSIDHRNVYQGQIGDCCLIAAISSLAYSKKTDLYNMFTQNEDGSFKLSFPSGETVSVAPSLEMLYRGATTYYDGFWLLMLETSMIDMIEKSSNIFGKYVLYTKWLHYSFLRWGGGPLSQRDGEIDSALDGIFPTDVIPILTGNESEKLYLHSEDIDTIKNELNKITNFRKVAVAHLYKINKKNLVPPYKRLPVKHCYSILYYDDKNGDVVIRNPWGNAEPSDPETELPIDGCDDGIFKVKLEQFIRIFDAISFET